MHGGAPGSGGPKGPRNGNYRRSRGSRGRGERRSHYKARGRRPAIALFSFLSVPTLGRRKISNTDAWLGLGVDDEVVGRFQTLNDARATGAGATTIKFSGGTLSRFSLGRGLINA